MNDAPAGREKPETVDQAFVCEDCGSRWYYDRYRCPDCAGKEHSLYELGTGELVAVTTVEMTPADVRSPNPLGLARFGDVQLLAQLDDETLEAGDPVEFAGAYRLRHDSDETQPRLTSATTNSGGL